MSLKNILCAYSGEAARGSGLHHAIRLATHHDAWVTGTLRHGRPLLERRFKAQVPEQLIEVLHNADAERIKLVRERFFAETGEAGMSDRADFVDLDPEVHGTLPEFARNFDLIVTGTHSNDLDEEHLSANPDLIALKSGRPVLVVPNEYEAEGLADSALVAWDGKRSSARALGDAMSILEEKAKVTVLTVGQDPVADKDYLVRNLERHGIDLDYIVRPKESSISATIAQVTEEVSAKLLVMGAFEHSKFSHDILGGVTTDIIRDTHVPVFLSH